MCVILVLMACVFSVTHLCDWAVIVVAWSGAMLHDCEVSPQSHVHWDLQNVASPWHAPNDPHSCGDCGINTSLVS